MPFTLSHSAAALPFVRSKYFSATGLIIGTMAPDFEYFFRMNIQGIYGHSIAGIFYFDVPMSLFLAFVFHSVVKKNLIDNLPYFLQSRFRDIRNSDFNTYFKKSKLTFLLSVILGTVTHIVWDGFTHQHQYFVKALPSIYEGRNLHLNGAVYPLWYVLQYISTILGGVLLGWYILMMKPVPGVLNKPGILYWSVLAVIMASIVLVRMQFATDNQRYVVTVITIVSAFCIGITILGLIPFRRILVEQDKI